MGGGGRGEYKKSCETEKSTLSQYIKMHIVVNINCYDMRLRKEVRVK